MEIVERNKCTGCTACKSRCPVSAIRLISDDDGFLYPEIDEDKCIKCNICLRICPAKNGLTSYDNYSSKIYAARSKDLMVRKESTSGGIFSCVSALILKNGGVVYGAAYNANNIVYHERVDNIDQLYLLRGSKYSQSMLGNIFERVKDDLDFGRQVLFSGTPCQVAGLVSFLGEKHPNLILVDFICHGVPAPGVFHSYLECRIGDNIQCLENCCVNLRSKASGWKNYSVIIKHGNSVIYQERNDKDLYIRGFVSDLFLRESCYNCPFKENNRASDIMLGDFWGIEHVNPEFADDLGISLVSINSAKGDHIWKLIKDECEYSLASPNDAYKYNPSAIFSPGINPNRNKFLSMYKTIGYDSAYHQCISEYMKPSICEKLNIVIRKCLKCIKGDML